MKIIKGTDNVRRIVETALKTGKMADKQFHAACLAVAYHAHKHGDIRLICGLVDGLPNSLRSRSLVAWLKKYAPIKVSKKKGIQFKAEKQITHGNKLNAHMKKGDENPFWELKQEEKDGANKAFDLTARLNALLKKAVEAEQKGELDKNKLSAFSEMVKHLSEDKPETKKKA